MASLLPIYNLRHDCKYCIIDLIINLEIKSGYKVIIAICYLGGYYKNTLSTSGKQVSEVNLIVYRDVSPFPREFFEHFASSKFNERSQASPEAIIYV